MVSQGTCVNAFLGLDIPVLVYGAVSQGMCVKAFFGLNMPFLVQGAVSQGVKPRFSSIFERSRLMKPIAVVVVVVWVLLVVSCFRLSHQLIATT